MADEHGSAESGESSSPGIKSTTEALREAIESVQSGAARESPSLPEHLRHLTERERYQALEVKRVFAQLEHDLREQYATWILKILGAQLIVTDLVFLAFAWFGKDWDLSAGVIEVWLAATVVQIVGIVLVVTRHLFPDRSDSAKTG
jgi:hypothetical protein